MLFFVQFGPFKVLVYAVSDVSLVLGCPVHVVNECIAQNLLGTIRVDGVRYPRARDIAEILLWRAAYPDLSAYEAAAARHNATMNAQPSVPSL